MKLLPKLGVLSLLVCAAVPFGCSSTAVVNADKADGSSKPPPADAGAPTCGGTACPVRKGIGIEGITQCCTDTNECGLQFPGADKCLKADQPGVLSAECGDYTVPGSAKRTLSGCCGPNGCGKNDAFLGCIVNTDLGLAAQTCSFDPSNNCLGLGEIPCDGPEDCPANKHCCANLVGPNLPPTGAKCYDSCVALSADGGSGTWRELCHAGDTCEDPTFQCRVSTFLPAWLTRCNNSTMGNPAPTGLDTSAGKVNCGDGVCATGQKCCDVTPATGSPIVYCADMNDPCKCHPPDGGTPTPRPDGGSAP